MPLQLDDLAALDAPMRDWLEEQRARRVEIVEMELFPLRWFLGRPFHALVGADGAGTAERLPHDISRMLRRARHGQFRIGLDLAHLERVGNQLDRAASRELILLSTLEGRTNLLGAQQPLPAEPESTVLTEPEDVTLASEQQSTLLSESTVLPAANYDLMLIGGGLATCSSMSSRSCSEHAQFSELAKTGNRY